MLKTKILKSSVLVTSGFALSQLLRFAGNLILTRLLTPEYFGLVGIAVVVVAGINMITDMGFSHSVIRSRNIENRAFLNTVWTLQIIRGFLLSVILLVVAAFLYNYQANHNDVSNHANIYHDRDLVMVLLVLSIIPIIEGFNSTNIYLQNRELKLSRLIIIDLVAQVLAVLVTVLLAYYFRNIWALVSGFIVTSLTRLLMSHLYLEGAPTRFQLDRKTAIDVLHFGKWIALSSLTGFLLSRGEKLLLGGFIDARLMGLYTLAFFLGNFGYQVLTKVGSTVFYPVLCEVQRLENHAQLKKSFYEIRAKFDILVALMVGFLFFNGQFLVELLYDDRYHYSGWILEMLSFTIIIAICSVSEQVFMALGKPRLMTYSQLVHLAVLIPGLYIAMHMKNFELGVIVIAFSFLPRYGFTLFSLYKIRLFSLIHELATIAYIVFAMIFGWLFSYFLKLSI